MLWFENIQHILKRNIFNPHHTWMKPFLFLLKHKLVIQLSARISRPPDWAMKSNYTQNKHTDMPLQGHSHHKLPLISWLPQITSRKLLFVDLKSPISKHKDDWSTEFMPHSISKDYDNVAARFSPHTELHKYKQCAVIVFLKRSLPGPHLGLSLDG